MGKMTYRLLRTYDPDILDDSKIEPISYGGEKVDPPEKGRELSDDDIRRALELCFAVEKPAQADRSKAMLAHLDEKALETLLLALQGLGDADAQHARASIAQELAGRKGGPGSGNWGHSSYTRVGKVGGSDPGGGLRAIGIGRIVPPEQRAEIAANYGRVRRSLPEIPTELRNGMARELKSLHHFAGRSQKEAARFLDAEGAFIGEQVAGDYYGVDIPDEMFETMHTFVHNHPSSGSFSPGDIAVLLGTNAQHGLVYARNGTIYRLSKTDLTPTPEQLLPTDQIFTWPGSRPVAALRALKLSETLNMEDETFRDRYKQSLRDSVARGEMTSAESLRELSHLAVRDLAKVYGLRYDRWKPE